jgi:signal transduction histidine kinase/streptogramin lyase
VVTALYEDKAGTLWIGTNGGGLNALNKKLAGFTHFKHDPANIQSLANDAVSAILEDQTGNLWIANRDKLSVLDRKTHTFSNSSGNAALDKSLENLYINSLYEDRQGLLWIGTNNGIKSFNPQTKQIVHYQHDPNKLAGLSDYVANVIYEDTRGYLWIGHGSVGLDRLHKRSGKFTRFSHHPLDSTSISSNIILAVFEDSKRNVWFGTAAGGLCRFDYRTGTFTSYTEQQGLANNTVKSILEDNEGFLWLGTNKGLSRFSPTTHTFINYNDRDGLQSDQFSKAAWKGTDGTLYFGGIKGFNAFDPGQLQTNKFVPPVVITQFKIFDKLVPGINEIKRIKLRHNQNFFSFEFAALNYTNAPKNQYAYQLVGVDPDWIYSGSRRYVSYTNLDPGEYVFRVKGSNNDGIWNEKGLSVRIYIKPPWWMAWYAYLVYTFLFVVSIYLFVYFRSRSLIREKKILADMVESRTAEVVRQKEEIAQQRDNLEQTLFELNTTQHQLMQAEKLASLGELTAGIAHEIQNPLNFVNNFAQVGVELVEELKAGPLLALPEPAKEEAEDLVADLKQNLEKIHEHGNRAGVIVKTMLHHSQNTKNKKKLTDINTLADEYLRLAYHTLRAKDKNFDARLITAFDKHLNKAEVVPQELSRALLNLYNNAFYAVQQKQKRLGATYQPEVKVSTRQLEDAIEISVRDNGLGIPEQIKNKIFQPFFTTKPTGQGSGLGLSVCYNIITKEHHGELVVETREGEYTEFGVRLPLKVKKQVLQATI